MNRQARITLIEHMLGTHFRFLSRPIPTNVKLTELGLDNLDMVEVIMLLEEVFHADITDDRFLDEAYTIEELLDLFEKHGKRHK